MRVHTALATSRLACAPPFGGIDSAVPPSGHRTPDQSGFAPKPPCFDPIRRIRATQRGLSAAIMRQRLQPTQSLISGLDEVSAPIPVGAAAIPAGSTRVPGGVKPAAPTHLGGHLGAFRDAQPLPNTKKPSVISAAFPDPAAAIPVSEAPSDGCLSYRRGGGIAHTPLHDRWREQRVALDAGLQPESPWRPLANFLDSAP